MTFRELCTGDWSQFFQILDFNSSRSIDIESVERVMTSPFNLLVKLVLSLFSWFSAHKTDNSPSYAEPNILDARERLKANCLKRGSMAFLISLVNLARYA